MNLRTAKRLHDARVAAAYIQEFISGRSFEEFETDALVRSAVERQFEILSESMNAAENLQPDVRERFPEISVIVGLRNRIVHSYDELNLRYIWDAAVSDIPELIPRLDEALAYFEFESANLFEDKR